MSIKNRGMGSGWVEPASPATPEYPYNNVLVQGESGHLIEADDTPGAERVRIQHRSKTFIEMHPNGDEVHKIYGDSYEITINDKNVLIKGHCSVTIEGDSVVHVKGNKIEKVDGDYELQVDGKYKFAVKDDYSILGEKDGKVGAGVSAGDASGMGTGNLTIDSGEKVYITADIIHDGKLLTESLVSNNNVDAKKGVTAGDLGFVTNTGGITVGDGLEPAVAIPKVIKAPACWILIVAHKMLVPIG